MPERLERFLETVRELEAELASLESIDPTVRSVLEEVLGDINEALHRRGTGGELERRHSLMERLRESAVGFESSHPNLFGVVERAINALGQMGI